MKCLQVILILLQILIFVLSGRLQDKLFQKKKIEIYRLDGRCRGKHVPILVYIHGATANTMEASCFNSTIVFLEDFDWDNYTSSIIANRCKSRENPDSCEVVYTKDNMNACQLMNMNSLSVSPFAIPYQPPMKCPAKKGVHNAYNVSINLTPFIFFPLKDWYWKINIYTYTPDKTRLLGCGVLEVRQLVNSKI